MIICRILKKNAYDPYCIPQITLLITFTYNMHMYDTHDHCPFELYCALGHHFIFKIGLANFYLVQTFSLPGYRSDSKTQRRHSNFYSQYNINVLKADYNIRALRISYISFSLFSTVTVVGIILFCIYL